MRPVIVVGAGWSGAVVAQHLTAAGVPVELYERAPFTGGHSRFETINGVVYEPCGPHILHTSRAGVFRYLHNLGLAGPPYTFCPLTEIDVGDGDMRMMSWPVQLGECESLPQWPQIKREVSDLPPEPVGADFESYVCSMMGRTLYELFIEGYTRKQWGREPSELSSSFAPRRVELRRERELALFRDRWEFFPGLAINTAFDKLLSSVSVTCGADMRLADLEREHAPAVVITAALDEFSGQPGELAWRGIRTNARYFPTEPGERVTPAYVINRPSERVPYTRTVETKHATGQRIGGTVVGEEYPGADARHYPVPTVDRRYERANRELQDEITRRLAPASVHFCGRLASYVYINQDEAIEQALACARRVLASLR